MNNTLNVTIYVKAGYYPIREQSKLIKLLRNVHKIANKSLNVERYAANN